MYYLYNQEKVFFFFLIEKLIKGSASSSGQVLPIGPNTLQIHVRSRRNVTTWQADTGQDSVRAGRERARRLLAVWTGVRACLCCVHQLRPRHTAHWPAEHWAGSRRHHGGEEANGHRRWRETRGPSSLPQRRLPRGTRTETLSTATTAPRSQVPMLRGRSGRFRFDRVN